MPRLNLLAKGNVDVHDSLLFCTLGGRVQWNGINEVVRTRFPDYKVRVRHETFTRSDALIAANGTIPADLCQRKLPLGPFPLEAQFSRNIFSPGHNAVLLSIQPDVTTALMKHCGQQYLFYPYGLKHWPAADRQWMKENFEYMNYLDVEVSLQNFARLVKEIQAISACPIVIYNLSAAVPGEPIHCYAGLDETLATRIRRFNLALVELSKELAISIVDVDAILARNGADRLKVDAIHLTPEGYRLVAEEVVRILHDLGSFDAGA